MHLGLDPGVGQAMFLSCLPPSFFLLGKDSSEGQKKQEQKRGALPAQAAENVT